MIEQSAQTSPLLFRANWKEGADCMRTDLHKNAAPPPQLHRREEAASVTTVQSNPPAARSLPTEHTGTLANEFMAAKLISCAIKVLRFFSTQRQWLGEISNDWCKYPNV